MQEPSLMAQGVELMLFGMGTVFVFLAALVAITSTMSALLTRYFPETAVQPKARPVATAAGDDSQRIAAISAAIHQYRSRHKR